MGRRMSRHRILANAIVFVLGVAQASRAVSGQQPKADERQPATLYSHTAEYQRMIEEIRSPAPSPAYIATGERPQADLRLKVKAHDESEAFSLETAKARFTIKKSSGLLVIDDLLTSASWALSLSGKPDCAVHSTPPSAVRKTDASNRWTSNLISPCGDAVIEIEVLTDGLALLTLQNPGADSKGGTTVGHLGIHVEGGGPFFGLGERFGQAGLSGTALDVRPQDKYGEPGHNWTYVAIPFVYGANGLGLYADTAFDSQFRFNQADSSFDIDIASGAVSLYLFSEANPKAVLSAYTSITGHPQNPPLWTFGPWITALQGKGSVLEVAHRIRTENMPASALWIYDQNDEADNLGWPFWFASYYGDPRSFVDTLHGQGFKVLTYVHPYVRAQILPYNISNPTFEKGMSDKLLVTGADGKPAGPRFELVPVGNVDFTNPAAVDWWQKMITNAVRTQGFDGWMEDFGEWVRDSDHLAAGDGRKISELYPLLYHKITLRIAQSINPNVVPFSRSGSPGSQQFSPVLWGADQWPNWSRDYGLPSVVTAGITAGMSGYSTWGPDILSAGNDRELWMRWVEFGALSPVMRDHVWDKPEHSFNLWSDAETTAHFRRWAAFHSSLLPYFAAYADEAHRTGIPIMRHTVLEYPDDPRSATAEYQYLLGRELLVAPVVQPGQQLRSLYLPTGEWVNFWNGDYLKGGQDVTVVSGVIPIMVRAGSVIPFKPEEEAGQWDWDDPQLLLSSLIWKAYLSESGSADSKFALPNGTTAHFVQTGTTASLDGVSKTARRYELILRTKQPPTSIRLNGAVLPAFTKASDGKQGSQWWWNPATFEVHIIFHASSFHVDIDGVIASQYENS